MYILESHLQSSASTDASCAHSLGVIVHHRCIFSFSYITNSGLDGLKLRSKDTHKEWRQICNLFIRRIRMVEYSSSSMGIMSTLACRTYLMEMFTESVGEQSWEYTMSLLLRSVTSDLPKSRQVPETLMIPILIAITRVTESIQSHSIVLTKSASQTFAMDRCASMHCCRIECKITSWSHCRF